MAGSQLDSRGAAGLSRRCRPARPSRRCSKNSLALARCSGVSTARTSFIVRLINTVHYVEAGAGSLAAPVGGPAGNKGINLVSFILSGVVGTSPADVVHIVHRTLA